MRKFGLNPVADRHTEILILGALPSDESLSKTQYYADSRNDFWKLMQEVLNERLTTLPYETRIQTLLEHRIGLWDVYSSCLRLEAWTRTFRASASTISRLSKPWPRA
jgi:hypoxanthine-DNA glycosylase